MRKWIIILGAVSFFVFLGAGCRSTPRASSTSSAPPTPAVDGAPPTNAAPTNGSDPLADDLDDAVKDLNVIDAGATN